MLQNLLAERVSIRDMRTIIDTLAEYAPVQSDPDELTSQVRVRLGRAITAQWFRNDDDIKVIGLDSALERLLIQSLQSGSAIEPGIAENLMRQADRAITEQQSLGVSPVVLVNPALHTMVSRFLRRAFPQLGVLSTMEISNNKTVQMTAVIGTSA